MQLTGIAEEVVAELRQKSKLRLYQRDPEAWYWDVLGGKWWSKQQEVTWSFADPEKSQTMTVVKSCNGIGKTRLAADLATYLVAVFDPMETTIISTAPIFSQIRTGLFRYINDNYNVALDNGFELPGRFVSDPALKVARMGGGNDKDVMQAKRPADNNLISSFQGIHDGLVAVFMDEAGGLPEDLWIGANAVTTNEHAKILAIGNPDRLHTAFHARFKDREKYRDWNTISISAYDSPNLTGEVVHPDPEKDKEIKSHLVQKSWVEMMERQAHPNVVLAKVHGEFPKDDASSFFTQTTMDTAFNAEITPNATQPRVLSADLAFAGEDHTTVYLNHGGKVRQVETWQYVDNPMEQARKLHTLATDMGVDELRLDASGAGIGVHKALEQEPEFRGARYLLIGIQWGSASPDNNEWAQFRSYMYDSLRRQMQTGKVDLSPEDKNLKEQLQVLPFGLNVKGAIQIASKSKLRSQGISSPDELDAVVMSVVDLSGWTGAQYQVGDALVVDHEDLPSFEMELQMQGAGIPIF